MTDLAQALIFYLAIAWTPQGPVVGRFVDLYECRVAVGYAEMQGYQVTPKCLKVEKPQWKKP